MDLAYKRNITTHLEEMMRIFPLLLLLGLASGQDHFGQSSRPGFYLVDLEKPSDYDRLTRDPEFFLKQTQTPIIFDEAQIYPDLFLFCVLLLMNTES